MINIELHWILNISNVRQSIHPCSVQSNVVIVEESFGSVSRWLKSSCPPAARWRECLWGDEIFAILFRNAKWKSIPNSLRNWDVDQSCRSLTIWWSTLSILITWNLWSIRSNRSIVYEVINRWSILLKSLTKTLYFWNDSTVHQNNYKSCYTVISCYF